MKLRRIAFALISLILCASPSRAQSRNAFKDLIQVGILAEDLSDADAKIGLTRSTLESRALVAVKRDIPKITVKDSAVGYVYVRITTMFSNGECVVAVNVELKRPVTVLTDDNAAVGWSLATVWGKTTILTGPVNGMATRVLEEIDQEITELAAAYYKANP
jgi:hypothetical protein